MPGARPRTTSSLVVRVTGGGINLPRGKLIVDSTDNGGDSNHLAFPGNCQRRCRERSREDPPGGSAAAWY
jgi:hypothetical protein